MSLALVYDVKMTSKEHQKGGSGGAEYVERELDIRLVREAACPLRSKLALRLSPHRQARRPGLAPRTSESNNTGYRFVTSVNIDTPRLFVFLSRFVECRQRTAGGASKSWVFDCIQDIGTDQFSACSAHPGFGLLSAEPRMPGRRLG